MYPFVELALSFGVLITLVTTLAFCVCGCKNSNQKEKHTADTLQENAFRHVGFTVDAKLLTISELVGTAGVVKIRLDEEAPSPTPTTPASVKRASTQISQRSLPDPPQQVARHDSGDTTSEIYAIVNLNEGDKTVAPSTSRDHPYEHAYAKVQNESHNITVEITPDQRSDNELEIDQREVGQSAAESVIISASIAISGQLPSSQELPYITPAPARSPAPPSPRPNVDNAVHFSGDSTDSAKGYTSISVREPLSNIRAQNTKPSTQPHYATVSDDSDEMYAAIEEASVGEGSDTYAQIAPEPRRRGRDSTPDLLHADAVHAARRSAPPEIGGTSSTNATHSRQASTSSSSTALGSPKPEKRQANSPLPPPPAHNAHTTHTTHTTHTAHTTHTSHQHQRINSTGDLFAHDKLRGSINEKHQRNNSCVSSSDFYGCNYPVDKHTMFSSGDMIRPLVARELNFDINGPSCSDYSSAEPITNLTSEHRITESPSRNVEQMYAKVMKKANKARTEEISRRSKEISEHDAPKFRTDDPGYETIDRKTFVNHGYETIVRKERTNSQNQDPGYETVKDISKNALLKLNHLNADSGPNSIVSSDPGYEHISKNDTSASDSDPNYEVLRNNPPTPPYATIAPNYTIQPTYSTVNKRKYNNWSNNEDGITEPNYESMPNDPIYNTGSESDPNYESVRPKNPNYESFSGTDSNYESLRHKDPKYESVRSKDSKYDSVRSKKDPNYESVKYFDVAKKEPPYEKVKREGSNVERTDSSAGYERINVPNAKNPQNSINNGTDGAVSDYFQV